jgi:hypothetical protein
VTRFVPRHFSFIARVAGRLSAQRCVALAETTGQWAVVTAFVTDAAYHQPITNACRTRWKPGPGPIKYLDEYASFWIMCACCTRFRRQTLCVKPANCASTRNSPT